MVELSKRNAARGGVSDRATFVKADLFETDLSKAEVITMFLLPSINMKLRPKILDLKPGTRIVVEHLHDGRLAGRRNRDGHRRLLEQLVHGAVLDRARQGRRPWSTPNGELTLTQNFQMLSGTLGNQAFQGRLKGNEITLDRRHHEVDRAWSTATRSRCVAAFARRRSRGTKSAHASG